MRTEGALMIIKIIVGARKASILLTLFLETSPEVAS